MSQNFTTYFFPPHNPGLTAPQLPSPDRPLHSEIPAPPPTHAFETCPEMEKPESCHTCGYYFSKAYGYCQDVQQRVKRASDGEVGKMAQEFKNGGADGGARKERVQRAVDREYMKMALEYRDGEAFIEGLAGELGDEWWAKCRDAVGSRARAKEGVQK